MATMKDVYDSMKREDVNWKLYGATAEWKQKVFQAGRKTGDAICEERGISKEQAASLPPETELGPKAQAAYEELVSLIDTENRRITSQG